MPSSVSQNLTNSYLLCSKVNNRQLLITSKRACRPWTVQLGGWIAHYSQDLCNWRIYEGVRLHSIYSLLYSRRSGSHRAMD